MAEVSDSEVHSYQVPVEGTVAGLRCHLLLSHIPLTFCCKTALTMVSDASVMGYVGTSASG